MKYAFTAFGFILVLAIASSQTTFRGVGLLRGNAQLGSAAVAGPYLTDGANYWISHNFLPATLPVASAFAWVNQGTATEANNGGALTLHAPPRSTGCGGIPCSSVEIRIRAQTIAANTQLTAAMQCTQHFWPYATCGIGFYETSTGKLETIDIGPNNDVALSNAVGVNQYSSVTSFHATTSGTGAIFPQTLLFRLLKTGGNLTFQWSDDGYNWISIWTESYTAFFTTAPDKWFYFNDNEWGIPGGGNVADAWATLLSWAVQ